jgi:hypothetical protein
VNIDQNRLDQALGLLGELLASRGRPQEHFVVCGGSALLALGLVRRTMTRDVDVLACMDHGNLVDARPLPDWLLEDARDVREQLNLPENWFNTDPAQESFFRLGFPDGLPDRLIRRDYGTRLCISFISRYDQIFFKLHAAADRDAGSRHFQDLQDLRPTPKELLAAARWIRIHDPSEGFLYVLGELFKYLGHGDLASQL